MSDYEWTDDSSSSSSEEKPQSAPAEKTWDNPSSDKKSWGDKGDKKWSGKPPPPPRLPFWVAIMSNDNIPQDKAMKLAKMGQFLGSIGFKIRYTKHNVALASVLEQEIVKDHLESFAPWKGFKPQNSETELTAQFYVNNRAKSMMGLDNPNFEGMAKGIQSIISINAAIMYGAFSESPVRALLTYTDDGISNHRDKSKETGYVSTAIELGNKLRVPVFNIGDELCDGRFSSFVTNYKK